MPAAAQMLIGILDIGGGWTTNAAAGEWSERQTISPAQCDAIYQAAPHEIDGASAGFENVGMAAFMRQEVRVFSDVATASAKMEVEVGLPQTCPTWASGDSTFQVTDILGAVPGEPRSGQYQAFLTAASGEQMDTIYVVVQRGRVISSMQLVGPLGLRDALDLAVQQMLIKMPPST